MVLSLHAKKQLTVILMLYLWWGERNRWREQGRRRFAAEISYLTAFLTDPFQWKEKNPGVVGNSSVEEVEQNIAG